MKALRLALAALITAPVIGFADFNFNDPHAFDFVCSEQEEFYCPTDVILVNVDLVPVADSNTIMLDDGTVVTTYNDGTVVTTYPDGTTLTTYADGSQTATSSTGNNFASASGQQVTVSTNSNGSSASSSSRTGP